MIFEINPGMIWGERCSYGIEDIRFHWGKIVFVVANYWKLSLRNEFFEWDKLVNEILHRSFPQSKTSKYQCRVRRFN